MDGSLLLLAFPLLIGAAPGLAGTIGGATKASLVACALWFGIGLMLVIAIAPDPHGLVSALKLLFCIGAGCGLAMCAASALIRRARS